MKINGKNIQFLDCTIRDGGYYTNWDFSASLVERYLHTMSALPVDYIELGYRSLNDNGYLGEYCYLPQNVLTRCKQIYPTGKFSVMINLKEVNENSVLQLLEHLPSYVELVRLATKPDDLDKALIIAHIAKRYKLKVAINIMYLSTWIHHPQFISIMQGKGEDVDYLVMVDSYGSVFPDEMTKCVQTIKQYFKGKIGFHGHNNMELAFANTLAAIEAGVDIVDATIMGMGRGAGNLKTELLMTYASTVDNDISLNALMDTLQDFETLWQEYKWGTNLPYMISGRHSLPQKDIMEWMTQKRYSTATIVNRLQSHVNTTETAPTPSFPLLEKGAEQKDSTTILVGGGDSVINHIDAILELIKQKSKTHHLTLIFASSKHFHLFDPIAQNVQRYVYLVGIEGKRLEKQKKSILPQDIFVVTDQSFEEAYIPSCAASQTKWMPLQVAENEKDFKDSPLFVSIRMAEYLHSDKMWMIGYDGYNAVSQPFAYDMMEENQTVIDALTHNRQLYSLFPTKYRHIDVKSIYSLLEL